MIGGRSSTDTGLRRTHAGYRTSFRAGYGQTSPGHMPGVPDIVTHIRKTVNVIVKTTLINIVFFIMVHILDKIVTQNMLRTYDEKNVNPEERKPDL